MISMSTCANALNAASFNRKQAFQTELAVGLAVLLAGGNKSHLTEAYAAAGYECLRPLDIDYKTVNRRVNASNDLFNHITAERVKKWAGRHREESLLKSLVIGLEPYELFTVADVQRLCAPVRTPQRVEPATDILAAPDSVAASAVKPTGMNRIIAMFQQAVKSVVAGAQHIETKHLALMVPDDCEPEEMIELATRLLQRAEEKKKELLTA